MNIRRVDGEIHCLIGIDARPAVRAQDHLLLAYLDQELGFGAGGLDHDDLAGHSGSAGERQMLRADAVSDLLPFRPRPTVERPSNGARFDVRAAGLNDS